MNVYFFNIKIKNNGYEIIPIDGGELIITNKNSLLTMKNELYAFTNNKEYANEFKKMRNMNLFMCNKIKMNKSVYDKYKNGIEKEKELCYIDYTYKNNKIVSVLGNRKELKCVIDSKSNLIDLINSYIENMNKYDNIFKLRYVESIYKLHELVSAHMDYRNTIHPYFDTFSIYVSLFKKTFNSFQTTEIYIDRM